MLTFKEFGLERFGLHETDCGALKLLKPTEEKHHTGENTFFDLLKEMWFIKNEASRYRHIQYFTVYFMF